ncbi:uncharacterized protein PGTG_03836 [Puccinia graminis f. sp. tritici CRL 75-36-700-3]|uniref:Retrovirus-related Pol polyprotein from transposon TNT 1-94-like beta-barrel domain-containing protein n=1 Tax=Puccinia graminis f. sp. tritici (strain CRL 75-36-700-3 / race SCCL) TaxID=418459 RepID=E3K0Q5_PUCGT|nr:uncharacterized protein PGTG_03836 [Puccinia graminis f. sp. tritici CRL 75-36-700-3]EFP77880.1 hypothetical protein PGTG_03836 [Puccinia graminis f. sp. tritici CRL 75-36-700-3]
MDTEKTQTQDQQDSVHLPSTSTAEIYQSHIASMIQDAVAGYNSISCYRYSIPDINPNTSDLPRNDLSNFALIDNRPPSPFLSPLSHIFSQYLTRQPPATSFPIRQTTPFNQPHPMSTSTASEITPRTKFLQQPSVYKTDVEPLAADGSNFDKWKQGLTQIILLTLGHANFFDKSDNYSKLSDQENTCLLFLIQITIHDELASLVDQYTKGTEAYDAIQTNFQGTLRFCQMELVDKLLELRVSGPSTEPAQIPSLFNKIFETFSSLHKVGAGLPPLVKSLILQAVVPAPLSMSRSQLFQNISLQLGKKPDVTARDIQTIITSAYGESLRFDSSPSPNVSVFRTWPNQNQWATSNQNLIRPPRQNPFQQNQTGSQPLTLATNNNRQPNVGRPGHPTIKDIAAAINNIRKGNRGPSDPNIFIGKPCSYCGVSGHWRSSCPTLRRDANLPPPDTSTTSRPASGFARQTAPPNDPAIGTNSNAAVRSTVAADATGAGGAGTVLDSAATHHMSGSFHLFSKLSCLRPPLKLNLASSDGSMTATHSGHLKITNGVGSLMIPRVLYSPEMTGTILSLGQLIDSGFKPSFLPNNDILLTSSFISVVAQYINRSWLIFPASWHHISNSIKSASANSPPQISSPSYTSSLT